MNILDAQGADMSDTTSLKIAVVTGSTRPGRNNIDVAEWVHQIAASRSDATYELVDIADFGLPLLDEPMPAITGEYSKEHTKVWAAKIAEFDGFVFVTAEYNHAPTGALKNAIDYLNAEWNDKAAGFVSYGSAGGVRAVEHLRLICGELQMADVRAQAALILGDDFVEMTEFKPRPEKTEEVTAVFDQVVRWAGVLKSLR